MHRTARSTAAALTAAAALGVLFASPANAVPRTFEVRMADGALVTVTVDAPAATPMEEVEGLSGVPVRELEAQTGEDRPTARGGERKPHARSHAHVEPEKRAHKPHRVRRRWRRAHDAPAVVPPPAPTMPSATSFRVPLFLLPVYQAAGIRYGVRWELLAAINEMESNFGRNAAVSSAGATGWMQFLPSTWELYGVDGNGDGVRDPANPVDAIFGAARYLQAAGAATDERRAVFAYNHADWYVNSVLLRAQLFAAYPADAVGVLTGLAQARFPVASRARYEPADEGRSVRIYARRGAPAVAVADGVVRRMGSSRSRGRFVVLEDAYGNRYVYSHLASLARYHPVPRHGAPALASAPPAAAAPTVAARLAPAAASPLLVRRRLFAHPARRRSQLAGGFEQILARQGGTAAAYGDAAGPPLAIDSDHAVLRTLRPGSRVLTSTMLGRVGRVRGRAFGAMSFQVRVGGRRALPVDPVPILDSWQLLSVAGFRLDRAAAVLAMPQRVLERRVLVDRRISIYPCGRRDIRSGRIDRRVLATLEYLAESGLEPSVSSLQCGHGRLTASGNVSEHSEGAAVDISSINGVPILGHQGAGGVAEQTVRRLMLLAGPLAPHQIITLRSFGANTLALADHDDHVHVGFRPQKERRESAPPRALPRLIDTLAELQQPRVRTRPSRFALRR